MVLEVCSELMGSQHYHPLKRAEYLGMTFWMGGLG